MERSSAAPPALQRCAIALAIFAATLTVRVWGISAHFPLQGDQIRDWDIVLGSFSSLPLIGPPTHVHGYTLGPAFYWIMWLLRVSFGPWYDNLPHAGGIGQAVLQSGADALLGLAVWYRVRSMWIALTTVVLLATASFDLSLSAVVWNPVVGSLLARAATALVIFDWPRQSPARVALTTLIAWSAVHAYTGAIFVVLGVLAALVLEPLLRQDRRAAWQNALLIAGVVALLQVPLAVHQLSSGFADNAMGAVTGSVGEILLGRERPHLVVSATGYANAFTFIEASPWSGVAFQALLAVCAASVFVRYRRDPVLLAVILVPQALAILGYAFWLSGLDHYYYLSLMPASVLTVLLGVTAYLPSGAARIAGVVLLAGALAIVPARLRFAALMNRMPEYGTLVAASRELVKVKQPIRAIRTEFPLLPTADPEFMYRILGGRLDPASMSMALVARDGRVTFRQLGAPR